MKKSSKPLQPVGLILAGLVCFLAIPLLAGSSAWAASPAGTTTSAQATPGKAPVPQDKVMGVAPKSTPSAITPYVGQAYSIVGPINVSTVSRESITLYTGDKDLGIDLTGKNVVVMDQNSRPLSLSAVKKGSRVYVCRKANNVVVVVLPAIAATGGANK
jgi:hypothetical protein